MRKMRAKAGCVWLVVLGIAGLLSGCRAAPGTPQRSADITAGDMQARVHFLADDRLLGRATPSSGLDIAAAFIRSEFQRIGLQAPPGGFEQRYQLVMTEMGAGWSLALSSGGRRAALRHGSDFWGLPWAAGTVEGGLRFVGDRIPTVSAESGDGEVWVARLGLAAQPREWLEAATRAGAVGIVFIVPADMKALVSHWVGAGETVYELGDVEPSLPAALVSDSALAAAMGQLGLEAMTAGASSTGAQAAARVQIAADLRVETLAAPNVVGVLQGGDPALREEYVLVSAHMDGLGVGRPLDGDSIYNGADDNASGTATLLEIAEAVAALNQVPRRSILFLAVSGEERGMLGSSWFVEHPPVPLERIVANLNIDMVGRNWEDTIAVIGKPYSTLGTLVDSVAAAHPELNVTPVGDRWPGEGFFFRSDHFNFARKGIPSVFFFNGTHEDYHMPSDEADKIDYAKAARIAQLIFEITLTLSMAEDPPRWDEAARERIVEGRR
ncbi:MAG TPA: M20/M25/M40 family metallo-hydrolase [Gemmatimonadota bacterium]|nr:M20/M25/M40 family metallo-hydrolase [Gemmatimonadota bacterium]